MDIARSFGGIGEVPIHGKAQTKPWRNARDFRELHEVVVYKANAKSNFNIDFLIQCLNSIQESKKWKPGRRHRC